MLKIVEDVRPRCVDCGSRKVHTAGFRFRVTTQDMVRCYVCDGCGCSFTAGSLKKMKRPKADVDRVVALAKQGLDYGEITRTLHHEQGRPISRDTVAKWVRKFAPKYAAKPKEDPRPEPGYPEAIRRAPRKVPVIHLDDLSGTRRVSFDDVVRKMARHPVVPFNTDVYKMLHGPVKGPNVHDRSLSVVQCRRLAKMLGVSMGTLERHAVTLYSGRSGHSKPQKASFPIRANGGHAFLMGLFYASGGVGETEIHYAVDRDVGLYLQQELVGDVGEVPTFRSQGCVSRKEHGSYHVVYSKVVQEELELFGLKTVPPIPWKRGKKGKFIPSRHLTMGVPRWVRNNPAMMHRFAEGYVNGLKVAVELKGITDDYDRNETEGKRMKHSHTTTVTKVAVRFCNRNGAEARSFMGVFVRHLERLGVTGWPSRARDDGRKMVHYDYNFHTVPQLRNFQESFLVLRPILRVKLGLMLARDDPIIRKVTQRISGFDGFVVGMLLEGPKTLRELAAACPKRPYNMSTEDVLRPSVEKLARLKIIRHARGRGVWMYEPSQFARNLAQGYLNELKVRSDRIERLRHKDIFVCRDCGTVGDVPTCERCGRPRPGASEFELRRLRNPKAKVMADELLAAVRK